MHKWQSLVQETQFPVFLYNSRMERIDHVDPLGRMTDRHHRLMDRHA